MPLFLVLFGAGAFLGPESSRSRFGLRLRDGHIWVVQKLGDEPPDMHGVGYPLPVKIDNLPAFVRMIVDDHLLNYPSEQPSNHRRPGSSLSDSVASKSAGADIARTSPLHFGIDL